MNPIGILYENLSRNRVDKQISGHPWQTVFHYQKERKKSLGLLNLKINQFFLQVGLKNIYVYEL